MATYCISDIHGNYDQAMKLFETCAVGDSDQIYVLGDIIDRGPKSMQMLKWAIDHAPKNVHFLLGNHEDMFANFIAEEIMGIPQPDEMRLSSHYGCPPPWLHNVDRQDVQKAMQPNTRAFLTDIAYPWIQNLPLTERIDVNGETFILVHAGLLLPDNPYIHHDALEAPGTRQEHIDIDPFGSQYAQNLIWIRYGWYAHGVPADDVHVVCGHTPNMDRYIQKALRALSMKEEENPPVEEKLSIDARTGYVVHVGNQHHIDCGSAYWSTDKRLDLAILRLDDMAAYYYRKGGPIYPAQAYQLDRKNN